MSETERERVSILEQEHTHTRLFLGMGLFVLFVGRESDSSVKVFFHFRIPPTVCFGHGASRGFRSTKKRNKHQ